MTGAGDVDEVFLSWYEQRERGAAPDPDALMAAHPEIAGQLAARIGALHMIDHTLDAPPCVDTPDRLGSYAVERTLGEGGMGRVYRACTTERTAGLDAGTTVALKVLHPHLLARPGMVERFVREATIGRTVSHPHVVRTFEAGAAVVEATTFHFLVMEYVEGQTLAEFLETVRRLPEALCRHIARDVASALEAIHAAGAVHRDLKPANVLITPSHDVKVMDLGVAHLQDEALRLSQTGAFIGSVLYAAPEQFQGAQDVDTRADLHALGVLLYELSSGRHPYNAPDTRAVMRRLLQEEPRKLSAVNPRVSPFFEELVHRLMAKDRGERFSSASEVRTVLEDGEASAWWQERMDQLRREAETSRRRIQIQRDTALFGRDRELDQLERAFRQAEAGRGRVVLIEGEAGIGKTRLVDAFIERLWDRGADFEFLFGSYPPTGTATSAGAFATALREHVGVGALRERLDELLPDRAPLVPAFTTLLRGESAPSEAQRLSKEALQTLFVELTRSLAARRPVVLLIDDLHFAGAEGRALFTAMALGLRAGRVLLLGTARPGVPDAWKVEMERQEQFRRIVLGRLGPKHLMHLLEDCFGSRRLAERLGHRIAVKSDGNPYFAFEIIRSLREAGVLVRGEDGTWITTQSIERIEIPSSILELIRARIAEIEEPEKELLDVAACCGFEFDPLLVAGALDLGQIEVMRRLAHIENRHGLVRSAGRRYVFDHHQVQEALYGALPPLLREPYHAALGEALEARLSDANSKSQEGLSVEVAEHYLAGAQPLRALPFLDAAFEHLASRQDLQRAADLAQDALRVPDLLARPRWIELQVERARWLGDLGHSEEAGRVVEEATQAAEALGDDRFLALALVATATHLESVSRYEDALTILGRADHHANRSSSATDLRMRVAGALGTVLHRLGRMEEAAAHLERKLHLARESDDRHAEASAACDLAIVSWRRARLDEARELFALAQRTAHAAGDSLEQARYAVNFGNMMWRLGRHEQARVLQERALAATRAAGNRRGEALALGNLGNTLSALGRYDDARALHARNLDLARDIGDLRGEATARHNLGMETLRLGDPECAREHLAAAHDLARAIGHRVLEPLNLMGLGEIACREDLAAAARLFDRAVDVAARLELREAEAEARVKLGAVQRRQGRIEDAGRTLRDGVRLARAFDVPGAELLGRCHLARLPGAQAAAAEAAVARGHARLDHAQRCEAYFLLWRATAKPDHLGEASRLLEEILARAPEDRRADMIAGDPVLGRVQAEVRRGPR